MGGTVDAVERGAAADVSLGDGAGGQESGRGEDAEGH